MASVSVHELMAKIGREPLPPVLLFCPGKIPYQKEPSFEPVLADRAAAKITETYIEPGMEDMAYRVFYADETQPGEIVLEAQTLPFLTERRVVLVRNAERYNVMSGEKKSALFPLIEYLKDPNESTLLLIVSAKIDKRKKFYKGCQSGGGIIECPQLDDNKMAQWVRDDVAARGKDIEPAAISELMGRAGGRLSDVNNATGLVVNYVGEDPLIREEHVIAACADVAEESVWTLTDAIAKSDPDKALDALYQLMDYGKSPDEILGLINWLLETAYRACPDTTPKLQSRFVKDKVTPLVLKFGLSKIKDACALCTDTQFLTRTTGVDRRLALELLVIKLAFRRKRAPARR